MAGIFVSGGSGLGKTTLIQALNEEYSIPLMSSFIREKHKKFPEIAQLPENDRQYIYEVGLYSLHQIRDRQFLSDRSVFDAYVRTGRKSEIVRYVDLDVIPPDLLVIVPTPPLEWYLKKIEFFISDNMRKIFYLEKAKHEPGEVLNEEDFANIIYTIEKKYETQIREMADLVSWKYFIPSYLSSDLDNFQTTWQKQAKQAIIETWGLPKFSD